MFEGYTTNALREARHVLLHAHALIADPASWTKGAWARDASGEQVVRVEDEAAIAWCVGGAVIRAQTQAYGGVGVVGVDPASAEPTRVLRPRRLVVALELLGFFLYALNRKRFSPDAIPPSREGKPMGEQDMTFLASDINDLPQITHAHVLLGTVVAIVAIDEELAARRRRGASPASRSEQ